MISQTQCAFLKRRSILDGVLCANECIDLRIWEGIPRIICKVDMEKAYDHVSLGVLLDMLWRYGFFVKWRNWIRRCVGLASFSALINGIRTSYFGCSHGLRQGDPISPLLWLLVDKVVIVNMLEGF